MLRGCEEVTNTCSVNIGILGKLDTSEEGGIVDSEVWGCRYWTW